MNDAGLTQQRLTLGAVALVAVAAVAGIAWWTSSPDWPPSTVVLNELVSSNGSTLVDEDGEHSDWIELHNPTDQPVELGGLQLSDDPDRGRGWVLPDLELPPGEHRIVFASGKDRADPSGELHTDFRLAAAGEPVLLLAADGAVVDRLEPGALPRDASYGRHPTEPWRTCYFAFPSPGEQNTRACFDDAELGAPRFSAPSGFFDEPFELTIDPVTPDATLYYTLDGSYPDPDTNPQTRRYEGPLRLEEPDGDEAPLASIGTWSNPRQPWRPPAAGGVPRGVVVRARTSDSAESAGTYLIGPHHRRDELPVVSLLTDPEHLFDDTTGIYVPGPRRDHVGDDEAADEEAPVANFWQRGRDWERPPADQPRRAIVMEYCEPGGACVHQGRVGVRIHGGRSRNLPAKSLRLYARQDYGGRTFDHPFFGDGAPADHRRLILRNSGQDWGMTMLLDGYVQELVAHLAVETQAYQPAVLYINGEYWGIHNLRERYDRHYLQAVHGVDPDQVALLGSRYEVEAGPADAAEPFLQLLDEVASAAPGDPRVAARVEAAIDLDSLIDYLVVQAFAANDDWPGTNVRYWRSLSPSPGGGVADGRWRWMVFDLDHLGAGLGRWGPGHGTALEKDDGHATLRRVLDTVDDDDPAQRDGIPTLTRWLLDDPDASHRFLSRFADHLNTTFAPARTVPELDRLEALLEQEMALHVARWTYPESVDAWRAHVEELRRFMSVRPDAKRQLLAELFDLEGLVTVGVQRDDPAAGTLRVNSIELAAGTPGVDAAGTWEGRYFAGVPVEVEAVPADGYRFVAWEGAPTAHRTSARFRASFDTDVELRPRFEPA